jgi:A/G-specific adenine glycosylase
MLAPDWRRPYNPEVSDSAALLEWYRRHRRDLPWRATRDPYRIWLSEVMLQQTRVETVVPFFSAFLERFPTVEALAEAPLEEVLAAWSGLGYYRRARFLHRAAGVVAARGAFPSSLEGLRALPGVGEYTAAAVASIAFGVAEPVLDGNVERVTARWLALAGDPKRGETRRTLRGAAAALLSQDAPGDSNQALMELGATVCTPRRPKCSLCPVGRSCRGAASGDPEAYPAVRAERSVERVERVLAVVEDEQGRVLLHRRAEDEQLLAGTWELPWAVAGERAAAELGARYGGRWRLGVEAGVVRHRITFRSLVLSVRRATCETEAGVVAEGPEAGWFAPREVARLPHSAMVDKALSVAGLVSGSRHRPRRG